MVVLLILKDKDMILTDESFVEHGLIPGTDYGDIKALEFEKIVTKVLSLLGAEIKRQFVVENRGDGHRGRIDIVATFSNGEVIPIEIDRERPRRKSLFKVRSVAKDKAYIILRSPFTIIPVLK